MILLQQLVEHKEVANKPREDLKTAVLQLVVDFPQIHIRQTEFLQSVVRPTSRPSKRHKHS